jgi:stage V sporulation protein B
MTEHSPIKNGLFLTIASFIFMVSGYLINIWLGRLLGPAAYGVYGVIISLMTSVNIIQTAGLPQATSKFIASGKEDIQTVLKTSLILQIVSTLIITVVFFALAPLLAILLNDPSLTPYLRATSLILPFYGIFSLYIGYYNGLHDFKRQALLNSAYSIAKFALVIGFVYVWHIYGAIVGFILSPIAALFFGFTFPKLSARSKGLYRPLIKHSLPLIGFAVLSTLLISIDLFMVKSLLTDPLAAGLYTAAQNIARIPYFALSAFALILFPTVSRSIHTDSTVETGRKIRSNLRYLFILLVPSTVLIASTSDSLLRLLYGSAYVAAAPTLSTLALGLGLITIFVVLANVINASHQGRYSVAITAGAFLLTGLSSLYLIPAFGLLGGAIATCLGGGIALFIATIFVLRRFPRSIPWRSFILTLVASIPLFVIPQIIHVSVYLLPFFHIFLGGIYLASLYFLKEISAEDLKLLSL